MGITVSEFVNVVSALGLFWEVKRNDDGPKVCGLSYVDEDIDAFLDEYGQREVVNAAMCDFGIARAYI